MRYRSTPFFRGISLAILSIVLSAGVAAEETPSPAAEPPGSLEAEVAKLHQTLERIADLLEAQVDAQQLDLAIKRLEVLAGRLERSERELRNLRASRNSMKTEQIALEEHRAQAALRAENPEDETPEEERRAFFRQMDRQLQSLRENIADVDRQIVELENEIATQRRDLEGWQSFVDRRLGGL